MAAADQAASVKIGIPSIVLMERAALSVADEISQRTDSGKRVMILSGPGNNGADGIAAGRILLDRGYDVRFMLLTGKPPAPDSSMQVQRRILQSYGVEPAVFDREAFLAFRPDVVVDALFGTGLGRELGGTAGEIVECVNAYRASTGASVLGLDIPSGISSEDGSVMGCAMMCDLTVTFAYYKRGHFLYPGSTYCGEKVLRQIGITDLSFRQPGERTPLMYMTEPSDLRKYLPARDPSGNKGTFGKILIIAGSTGMCGAAVLSARAALRSGAGMVKVFTTDANRVIIQQAVPEALLTTYTELSCQDPGTASCSGIPAKEEEEMERLRSRLISDLQWADVAAIGPGLSRSGTSAFLLKTLLEAVSAGRDSSHGGSSGEIECRDSSHGGSSGEIRCRGIVIDADALRLLAQDRSLLDKVADRDPGVGCILTPHLLEFADLMHLSLKETGEAREALLHELAERAGCAVTGKDARTMIAGAGREEICLITNGNSGMAAAGSGDVLTGITAAVLFEAIRAEGAGGDTKAAQYRAAEAAAYIHAAAGDRARDRLGEYGMTAGDLTKEIGAVMRELL